MSANPKKTILFADLPATKVLVRRTFPLEIAYSWPIIGTPFR